MNNDNFISFLRDKKIRALAAKLPMNNTAIRAEAMSDFDVFNTLCENLYLLAGHHVRRKLLNILSEACNLDELTLYDIDFRKALWQKMFFDENIILPQKNIDILKKVDIDLINNNSFDLDEHINTSFDNVYDLLDFILKKLDSQGADAIYFNSFKIEYQRPDDYHAALSYEELKKRNSDASVLKLWLLCRILMKTDVKLILKENDLKKAESILNLIFVLKISPKICMSVDIANDIDAKELYRLIMQHNKKSISVELRISKEMQNDFNIEAKLKEIFYFLPIAFVESVEICQEQIEAALTPLVNNAERALIISFLYRVK